MRPNNSVFLSLYNVSCEAFASVNVAVSVSSIFINSVFVFCMLFPLKETERVKQPLQVLLGSLVSSNIAAHICILVMVFNNIFESFITWYTAPLIAMYTMMSSVTSSHWLNVFYCCQIISVQHPYLIWLKRNIKIVIYCALIVNTVLYLFGLGVTIAITYIFSNNKKIVWAKIDWTGFSRSVQATFWVVLSLIIFSLSVMLVSSCITVVYLWRHLKNMQESSSGFTSSHRRRQIKSIIKGITVQAVLHFICSVAVIIIEIMANNFSLYFDPNNCIRCTIFSLYFFGTAINMGIIQSVFRKRVVHVWQTIFQSRSLQSVSRMAHTIFSDIL